MRLRVGDMSADAANPNIHILNKAADKSHRRYMDLLLVGMLLASKSQRHQQGRFERFFVGTFRIKLNLKLVLLLPEHSSTTSTETFYL